MYLLRTFLLTFTLVVLWIPQGVNAIENATTTLSISPVVPENMLLYSAIQLRKNSPELFAKARGFLITETQAEKNGLQRGDIIIALNGHPMNTFEDVSKAKIKDPKQEVKIQFIRAGVVETVVFLAELLGHSRPKEIPDEMPPEINPDAYSTILYKDNQDARQILSIQGETALKVSLKGKTELGSDFIEVLDKDGKQFTPPKKVSGYINETFIVAGDSIQVHFTSNESKTSDGVTVTITDAKPRLSTLNKRAFTFKKITLNFSVTDFQAHFMEPSGSALSKISLTALPKNGTLKLGTTPVALNQEINASDIDKLVYMGRAVRADRPAHVGPDSFQWNGSNGTAYAPDAAQVNLIIQTKIEIFPGEPGQLQSIIEDAKPGDYIVLKAGVHLLVAPSENPVGISIANKSYLTLAGAEDALIQISSGYESLVAIRDSHNITLKNLHFKAEVAGQACCTQPVITVSNNAKQIDIVDSMLTASGSYAVSITDSENVTIAGGEAKRNTQGGFKISKSKGVTIKEMLIADNQSLKEEGGLFEVQDSQAIAIVDNAIANNQTTDFKRITKSKVEEHNSLSHNAFTQTKLNTAPILRLETGMHTAKIGRIGVDASERYLVTGSHDKTVRVWSLPEGRLLQVLRPPIGAEDEGKIYAVAISPDGKTVATGGWTGEWDNNYSIYLFDRATGELRQRLTGHENVIFDLAYSPDGRYLVATLGKNGIRIYRTTDYRLQAEDTHYGDRSEAADFDNRGQLVTSCDDGYIRLYDSDFKLLTQRKASGGNKPYAVNFSPTGDKIAVGFSDSTKVNVLSGEDLSLLYRPNTSKVDNGNLGYGISWSQDGRWLYATGTYDINGTFPILRWSEAGRGDYKKPWADSLNSIMDIRALRNGEIFFGAAGPTFGRFNANGEKKLYRKAGIGNFRYNDDGFMLSKDGSTMQFSYKQGKRPARFSIHDRTLSLNLPSLLFDSEVANLTPARTTTPSLNITRWWTTKPKLNGNTLPLQQNETARSLAITPDGQQFLLGTSWYLRLFDKQGEQQWKKPVPGTAWGVNIAGNGKVAVAAFADGIIRWYRLEDGEELLALFPHKDGKRWVLWTPQGYYMASPGGEELMGWHINRGPDDAADFYPASRFREQFYRPDVVTKVLGTLDINEALLLAKAEQVEQQLKQSLSHDYHSDVVAKIAKNINLADTVRVLEQKDLKKRLHHRVKQQLKASLSRKDYDYYPEIVAETVDSLSLTTAMSLVTKEELEKHQQTLLAKQDFKSRFKTLLPPVVAKLALNTANRDESLSFSDTKVKLRYSLRRPSGEPITGLKILVDGRPLKNIICRSQRTNSLNANASTTRGPRIEKSPEPGGGTITTRGPRIEKSPEPGGGTTITRGINNSTSGINGSADCTLPQDEQEYLLSVSLPPRDVSVSLIAENRIVASEPVTLQLRWAGDKTETVGKPNLYVLAVGVSDYDDEKITDLSFAAKDAQDFLNFFQNNGGNGLYNKVIPKLLKDATRADIIENGLGWIKKVATKPQDTAIVFFAGHGVNEDRSYYFLPRDTKGHRLSSTAVPYYELKDAMAKLPGKVLFFIDTCHSGNLMGGRLSLGNVAAVSNELSSAETGVIVFTASTGVQLSQESPDWGNGVFTMALLEGLKGEATSKNGQVTFIGLNLYVSDRVQELTYGKQTPAIAIPKTMPNFSIVATTP
ncbi:caspase family protein [Candidatus Parabeggiatoa sp. HSG14]|uniref:caspase family protein n=1 Tax=Candidatus Parabeggiatoa sp. HSG14 TaxID=3055593 RepID=UPI0025A8D0F1|nr:caspase family protein [Thiotrichales bacterium HSG14]